MKIPGVVEFDFPTALIVLNPAICDERHCPRCWMRGDRVRWFSVREDEFQKFCCELCGYRCSDR